MVAHRTSPTNIGLGMAVGAGRARLRLRGHRGAWSLACRARSTPWRRWSASRGHLLNWYDTQTLEPLHPGTCSTVDSGNLAASLVCLAQGLRQLAIPPGAEQAPALHGLAQRADALLEAMDFRFLYDTQRKLFAIGYRLADADGPARLDPSFYDLLASEARLASFIAIAKGDVPSSHWFALGRPVTSVDGVPTLLSWSATAFEYLMPLLFMKRYPETLLDRTCVMAVRRMRRYGEPLHVPWGISESAYAVTDRAGNYQYKAFGVPGLGLKRGLADDLVVAPYATALAALVDPEAAVANLRRLQAEGLHGRYGFFESIDYTPAGPAESEPDEPRAADAGRGQIVKAYLAHHQGMTLVALADRAARRRHGAVASTRPARAGHRAAAAGARAARRAGHRAAARRGHARAGRASRRSRRAASARPTSQFPHAHFLSNGAYTVDGHQRGRRRQHSAAGAW